MKRMAWVIIYIFILLFGQVLFAAPSFAEDCTADADCGENAKCESGFCVSADSSITPADAGAGSSAGSAAAGGGAEFQESGIDQRCWKKQDCEQTGFGKFIGPNIETKEACKTEKDASNNQIGFCLPTKQAQMGLNWGEAGGAKSTYTHIGEFIQWIYKYGIVVAGILAVMMIIKAGFDWIISGGNQEMVSGAHKKIGNAMMGLFLAVMAYFVLNLINPYLVNFRLPNVWMINTAGLVPPYCDQIKDKKFHFAKSAADKEYIYTYAKAMQDGFKKYSEIKIECGKEYYVEGSNGLTCGGTICDEGNFCAPEDKGKGFVCKSGMLGGNLDTDPQFLCSDLTGNIVDNNMKLIAMCKDGDLKEVADIDLPDSARKYVFSAKGNLESVCGVKENLVGFYIGAEINDEGGGIVGSFCAGGFSSTGCDDWHAIGKSSPHNCDLNLAEKTMTGFQYDCQNAYYGNAYACACGGFSQKERAKLFTNNQAFVQSLISLEELQGGYYCDIKVKRSEFPALDNFIPILDSCTVPDPTGCFREQK